ncbi:MAG: hypothetical protein DVS81_20170 [Candidatus Accumulibacter meliphilus]|uniref:Novel STAND NTPase 1 domain-containing protein n=1 Tax=Candidatus Accumulibacter meliphilus TaxID=2211374 RepID=A0A369XHF5_9PROT|nr:MAG: hypothetical protein DVS81_20170 [Candidatus Accumulibacter meliphilus]
MSNLTPPASDSPSCLGLPPRPYPGLRAFEREEWPVFFGRETMAEAIMRRLQRNRLVVVHGSSGSGKSSLIFAEVLPQLQRRRHRQGTRLAIVSMRPGSTPLRTLAATLHGLAADVGVRTNRATVGAPNFADLRIILARGGLAAAGLEDFVAAAGFDQLCLYIDQFEELFRYTRETDSDEARLFAEVLVGLAVRDPEDMDSDETAAESGLETLPAEAPRSSDGPCVVLPRICAVVTMRSEFFGDCARYPDLAEVVNRTQYLLPQMKRPDLLRAIREPAAAFGGSVAWELADRLVRDAAREKDPLPLVQHALMRLWNKHAPHLSLEHYEDEWKTASPGDDGEWVFRSGLSQMLAKHANEALAKAVENDQERSAVAQHLFRALTDIDREGRGVRREQRLNRLRAVADPAGTLLVPILDELRADGVSFLRPSTAERPTLDESHDIDIVHEALIRSWPRLANSSADQEGRPHGWLHREFQEGLAWRALAARALEFKKDHQLVLPPATMDLRWPWFEEVRRRPAWALRHLITTEPGLPIERQPEWLRVTELMEASNEASIKHRNLLGHETKLRVEAQHTAAAEEQRRLEAEHAAVLEEEGRREAQTVARDEQLKRAEAERREAVLRLERNRRLIPALLALLAIVLALLAFVVFLWFQASSERDEAQLLRAQANTAKQKAEDALKNANMAALDAQNASEQAQRNADQRLADFASDVQKALPFASSAVSEVIKRYLPDQGTSQALADAVAETPSDAAQQIAKKVEDNSPAPQRGVDGFMWIGSEKAPRLASLNDGAAVDPAAVQPGGQYRVTSPTVLRQDMPTEDTYRTATNIGFVTVNSLVQVLGSPRDYQRPSGTQYWARLRVQPAENQIAAGYRATALDALLSHQIEPALKALADAGAASLLNRLKEVAGTLPQPADNASLSSAQAKPWDKLYKTLAGDKKFLDDVPSDLVNRLTATIGTVPLEQGTIWFQFSGASREDAQKIAADLQLKNYLVPGEERRSMTTGLRSIRYFYAGDEPRARQLATDVRAILKELSYETGELVVQDFSTSPNKPRPGSLELWLALPQRP